MLARLAERIADNRIVAGVHYEVDADAGRLLAEGLWKYLKHRSTVAQAPLFSFGVLWAQALHEWEVTP
jgi:hypothetical protein